MGVRLIDILLAVGIAVAAQLAAARMAADLDLQEQSFVLLDGSKAPKAYR
jgi:hypothetical protein